VQMTWSFWQHHAYQHQYDQPCAEMTTLNSTFDLPYASKKPHGPNWGLPMYTFEEHPHVFTFYVLGFLFYTHTHLLCPTKDFNIVFANLSTSIAQRNFSILPLVEFVKQLTEVNFNFWHTPWQPCNQKFPKQKLHIIISELNPKLCVDIGYKIEKDVYRAIKTWFVSCRHKFGNCYDMDTYTLDNLMHNDPRNTLTSKLHLCTNKGQSTWSASM
jgi:hypothetical protein